LLAPTRWQGFAEQEELAEVRSEVG
jgi:hypothetical protein